MKTIAAASLLAVLSRTASGAESAAVAPRPCPAGLATKATYAVMFLGNRAGALVVCGAKDGSETLLYAFNDRGRGPDTTTKLRLDARGVPVSVETTGVDYLKSKIAERFTLAGGRASWENKAEKGGKTVAGSAYYVGYSSPPSDLGTLAAALGKAKDGRLPLLPDGEARLEKRGEKALTASGKTRTVVHDAIYGLGFTPQHVWLDGDGAFFASVSSWSSIVREGWEPAVPELLKEQEADDDRRHSEEAKRLSKKPAGAVAFTNARLFDSVDASVKPGTTVLVEGNRIAAVGPDGGVAIPEGAERIDADGKTLMPGLWDMHVHLGADDGVLHLAAGVTSVRDLANDDATVRGLEKRWDAGEALGPRVVRAGFIDGPGPYQGPTKALASTADEVRSYIRDYASKGYVQIKLYSSLKPELVTPAALEAHRLGMRLSGHIPAFMTAEQAVRAGYDEIQHLNMLFLNFFDDVKDTRTPARFTAVAERAAELDLGSPRVKEFLALLKDRHTVVDATVAIFENMFVDRPGTVSRAYEKVAHRFPAQVRRGFFDGGLPVPEGKDARYQDSFRACLKLTNALHDAGIPIVAGTDGLPGFQLPRDLELYVEAGIPPAEVLRMATLVGAAVAGKSPVLGSITPGKLADLLLIDGDPAAKISDVRNVALVMKDGVMYDPAALSAAVGMKAR
jgi:imidazolonepropionase-like amidohydrolase